MTGPVVEITGLRKEYRKLRGPSTIAVDGLDLVVEGGGVFGFLGPNGSGKTTTIRCLLGLVRPTSGVARLFGRDATHDLASVVRRVGAIVEAPAQFPTMTARRNLELLASLYRIERPKIDEVLEIAGLAERHDDLVKNYSLGMRQRLGIAAALLKDPDLLILDEPANGLDPAGIREVRQLLRRLCDEGRTIFVSSHILSEIQATCDRVAILARGRCVAVGDVHDVLTRGRTSSVLIKIADAASAQTILEEAGVTCLRIDTETLRAEIDPDRGSFVVQLLARRSLYPREIRPEEIDLESVFLQLTADREEVAA